MATFGRSVIVFARPTFTSVRTIRRTIHASRPINMLIFVSVFAFYYFHREIQDTVVHAVWMVLVKPLLTHIVANGTHASVSG